MKITEESIGRAYKFLDDVDHITDDLNQGITKFNFPNQEADEGMFFRFSGQTREISFDCYLRQTDTDRSDNGYANTVKTPTEQREYLYNEIFKATSDANWTLYDSLHYPNGKSVAIKSINVSIESTDPLEYKAKITFIVSKNAMS